MNLISLSWRNLFRYTRRTIITSLAIAVGIAIYIWMDGWMLGIEQESDRNLVWYETGSAAIFDSRFWQDRDYMPLKYGITDQTQIMDLLAQNGIRSTERIGFRAEIFANDISLTILMSGINPATDEDVFRIKQNNLIRQGEYLAPGKEEILIGSILAEDLAVRTGDSVEIRTRTKYGAFNTITLTVAGIMSSPNPVVDRATGLIPIDIAKSLLDMDNAVTQIVVSLPELSDIRKQTERVNSIVASKYTGLTVQDFKALSGDPNIISTKKNSMGIILFLIFIIAAVGITNTMIMSVYERVREIGMMRALGMEDKSIRRIFTLEAAGIGLIGSAAGVVLGVLLNFYTVTWGFDFSALMKDVDIGYRVGTIFRGAWNVSTIATTFVFGVIISAVCSWIPSSKAIKMSITDCLRYQ
jgi:putative ABC transport system permease protein